MASLYEIDRNSIMCPICLDIFIEPVTLLCKHELCKQCYEEHFEKADFRCPLCKKRLSSWARKCTGKGSLVNMGKWKYIQDNFAELVEKRQKGEDNFQVFQLGSVRLAKDGEIHKEYIQAKLEWESEKKAEVDEQETASYQLIQKILKEEKEEMDKVRLEQIKQDQELAKVISEQLNQPISPTTVGKKLLRSTTSSAKKKRTGSSTVRCNSIEKYCIKKSSYTPEKENSSPNTLHNYQGNCVDTIPSSSAVTISALSPKRMKLSTP